MGGTWNGASPPAARPIGATGWLRVAAKGTAVGMVVFGALGILLAVRLVERPLHGRRRPWTPWITQGVCRAALALIGIRREIVGRPDPKAAALVASHASWLDIFALNSAARVVFVAKAEVRAWPGIGWLARATGTMFVRRDRADALAQRVRLRERMEEGTPMVFFPEGTSTDGFRVLPFKPALFDAMIGTGRADLAVQPVSIAWFAPAGADPRFYGWWGEMDFARHLLAVLAAPRQGRVVLRFHPSVTVAANADRKTLAHTLENMVRDGQPLADGRSA